MKTSAIKGKFKPQNVHKTSQKSYVYRSLWERRFMLYCDRSPNIRWWTNEELYIPYISPKDDRVHNYYPDFFIKYVDKDGIIREKVVEIKPFYQKRWDINKAKWKSAKLWCNERGYLFQVLTEKELF